MTLVKFKNPHRNEFFNSFFNDSFIDSWARPNPVEKVMPVNVKETENAFTLEMVLPGFSKEQVKINVEADKLVVKATKETATEEKQEKYLRKEFSYANTTRSFILPEIANTEAIEANYTNGVLHITIPKKNNTPQVVGREISVN